MTNEEHLYNINSISSIRGKLEYCVDHDIYAASCSPEILEILEDLRDQVEYNVSMNQKAEDDFSVSAPREDNMVATPLGMDRRPISGIPGWEIDNLGNVFNTRGQLAAVRWGQGHKINNMKSVRPGPDHPHYFVAHLMLKTFCPDQPVGRRILFLDNDTNNCNINNLRWLYGSDKSVRQ